jgi:DNA-binding winged helix-turn-helix (wHTH) protein/Tfp pilus assembly protein PilF
VSGHGEVYAFGDFRLDAAERQLSRDGRVLPLSPKAHDLLLALVRRAGHLVTKQELLDSVWPDAAVEEGIVAVHVSSLRAALGDRAPHRRYIETVSRSGYRFIAPVATAQTAVPAAIGRPGAESPAHPDVHELVGVGRAHLLTASRPEIAKAVAAFRAALALDANYAPAHAGLALAACAQGELRIVPHAEAYEEARGAALRALAMDPSSADAQVALGAVLFLHDWNWTGAARSLERAIELNPAHTDGWLLYGRLLETRGDLAGGLAAKQRALEQAPSSSLVHLQIALSFWNQRRYHDMILWANRALTLDPNHLLAREYIVGAYWKLGDFDRQMDEGLKHARSFGVPEETLAALAAAYRAGGRLAVLRMTIESTSKAPRGVASTQLALLYGETGQMDEAFANLNDAIEHRDPCLVHLAVSPQWDVLRQDARFDACLARLGLPTLTTVATTVPPSPPRLAPR